MCYAVGRLNLCCTSSLASSMSPYRLFTGTRFNYKKSLSLDFGDYAEVYDGSDNSSRSRSLPCIALHPCNNLTGSWEFLNLTTGARIRRSNWRKMVTTQAIVDKMNSMTSVTIGEEAPEEPVPEQNVNIPVVEEVTQSQYNPLKKLVWRQDKRYIILEMKLLMKKFTKCKFYRSDKVHGSQKE
jgi:hypothetical protein